MGLDRLDNNARRVPNGYFDFVEGYTVDAASGRIFFPVVEPFGRHLAKELGDTALARRFAYTELYDSTHTVAKQIAEHNKFRISGKFKATSRTKSTQHHRHSARECGGARRRTTADGGNGLHGGLQCRHGEDSEQEHSRCGHTRFVLGGIECGLWHATQNDVRSRFPIRFLQTAASGGTLMHLGEQPLTSKVAMGSEPLNNTIWGLNMSWKKESSVAHEYARQDTFPASYATFAISLFLPNLHS